MGVGAGHVNMRPPTLHSGQGRAMSALSSGAKAHKAGRG